MRMAMLMIGALALVAITAAASWTLAVRQQQRREQANVDLVLKMWDGVINHAHRATVMNYIAPDYRQHNPNVTQGRDGVLKLIAAIKNPPPGMVPPGRKTLLHAIAQGDYVVVIWDQPQPDPLRPGETYVGQAFDMFRIRDGQVVEHWDDTRKAVHPWMQGTH